MATWDDLRRLALDLPGTSEETSRGRLSWHVGGKAFVAEGPLRRADLEALGDDAPAGPVAVAHVPDVGVKEALVASSPEELFTTPHFTGYPAVLLRLDRIDVDELREVVVEAWLTRAPRRAVAQYLAAEPTAEPT